METTEHTDSEIGTHGSLFDSELLGRLSELISRWSSYHFQAAHATRLDNALDFTSNGVLRVLGENGPCRPSVLAAQLATGRPNVSKVVRRLERLGLVSFAPDPRDSRASLVSLTAEGVERSRDVFRIGDEMISELTADWDAAELAIFSALVARLNVAAAAYEARLSGD